MGQQQLLLLILTIVVMLVGVVAGLGVYDQQRKKSEADTVLNRSMIVAQAAIEWRARDELRGGGGGGSYSPLAGQGVEALNLSPSVIRTQIVLSDATDEMVEIIGVSVSDPEIAARVVVRGGLIESSEVRVDSSIVFP